MRTALVQILQVSPEVADLLLALADAFGAMDYIQGLVGQWFGATPELQLDTETQLAAYFLEALEDTRAREVAGGRGLNYPQLRSRFYADRARAHQGALPPPQPPGGPVVPPSGPTGGPEHDAFESFWAGVDKLVRGPQGKAFPFTSDLFGQAFTKFLNLMLSRESLPAPLVDAQGNPLEEAALQGAGEQLLQRFEFGLAAHATAFGIELLDPLKNLGLSQVAGALGDFAGFAPLARGILGPYELAGINLPITYQARDRFRTTIPDARALEDLYARKGITPKQMARFMALQGFADVWIELVRSDAFRPLTSRELMRLSEFLDPAIIPTLAHPTPDATQWWTEREGWVEKFAEFGVSRETLLGPDWYWWYKLSKSGFEPTDVVILVQVAKRASVRREQSAFLSAATALYVDGLVTDAAYQALVEEAWGFTNAKSARKRVAQLRAQANDTADLVALVLKAISRGALTTARGRDMLLRAGMRSQRVKLELLKERLGAASLTAAREPAEGDLITAGG